MVREYARLGHTVGIHTWSHQNLHRMTPLKARAEIELGFSAVQQALGKPVAPFFRFPYLADSKGTMAHLKERNIAIFSIDVDSKDFRTRNPESVHRKVARSGPGLDEPDELSERRGDTAGEREHEGRARQPLDRPGGTPRDAHEAGRTGAAMVHNGADAEPDGAVERIGDEREHWHGCLPMDTTI